MEAFSLFAKLTLDSKGFDDGLGKAKSSLEKMGSGVSKMGSAFTGSVKAIGSGLATVAKAGAVAVGTAATAVGALVAKSVSAYSDYEQLVGGVQKLYGNMGMSLEEYAKQQGKTSDEVRKDWERNEEAANMMMKQANNAFKTSGMSANQYMETATSFSAALIKSVGGDTVEAAKLTDQAMTAISDNWNTFGGDIGMIQGTFQNFAKQNYSMLDNLKLGYGGTKEEMKQLIADAAKASDAQKALGLTVDATSMSFDNIVKAIQVVQYEQQIYGTTAREASTTIQGSLSMVKAAWENLITGMADKEADFDGLIQNMIDSIVGYDRTVAGKTEHINGLIDNILPVAEKALSGVSVLIEKLGPKIAEVVPDLITKVLPNLIQAGAEIVSALGKGIWDTLPKLMEIARDLLRQFGDAIWSFDFAGEAKKLAEKISSLFDPENGAGTGVIAHGARIIRGLLKGISEALPELAEAASGVIMQLVEKFAELYPEFIDVGLDILVTIADSIVQNLDKLIEAGTSMITKLIETIREHAPDLMSSAETIIKTLFDALITNLPQIMGFVQEMIQKLISWITENAPKLIESAVLLITTLVDGLVKALPDLIPAAVEMILTIVEGLLDNVDKLIDSAIQLIMALADGLIKALPKLLEKAPVIIEKLIKAIIDNVPKLVVAAGELVAKLVVGIVQALPKLLEAGMKIVDSVRSGIISFLARMAEAGKEAVEKVKEGIKSINPIEWGKDMIESFIEGIKNKISKVKEAAKSVAEAVKDILGFSEPDEGPLSNFHTFAPDMMNLFAKGVRDNTKMLQDQIEKSFNFSDVVINSTPQISTSENAGNNSGLLNNITMNIYGAEGQDVKKLADYISDRLMHQISQTGAVYA